MYYKKEDIERMGFNSIDEFLNEQISNSQGCCFRIDGKGVHFCQDNDTMPGLENMGAIYPPNSSIYDD